MVAPNTGETVPAYNCWADLPGLLTSDSSTWHRQHCITKIVFELCVGLHGIYSPDMCPPPHQQTHPWRRWEGGTQWQNVLDTISRDRNLVWALSRDLV